MSRDVDQPLRVYVCAHTHWDREWYAPFNRFRMKLVQVVDELLALLAEKPEFTVFHLDGQMAPVADYLEIRPDRAGELESHIRSGRLKVGPWQVLADEFLVSGESFIRNLEQGIARMRSMGGETTVAYSPDCFGRPAQMPQILRGFGLDATFIWRGFASPDGSPEAEWVAPDGSRVMAFILPQDYGYSEAMPGRGNLPPEEQEAWGFREGWAPLHQVLPEEGMVALLQRRIALRAPLVQSDLLMLLSGVDHTRVLGGLPEAMRRAGAQDENAGYTLELGTWDAYFEGLSERIRDGRVQPREVRGPLRNSWHHEGGAGAWILPGCLSARISQKQRNDRIQTLLERTAEPAAALGRLLGGPDDRGFLSHAWKRLLENHPHDSICGCSVDDVHRQMESRFDEAEEIATGIVDFRMNDWLTRAGVEPLNPDESALIVFNPLPWERAGVVEVEFLWRTDLLPRYGLTHLPDLRGVEVIEEGGDAVPVQLLGAPTQGIRERVFEREHFAPVFEWIGQRALIEVSRIPGMGYSIFRYRPTKRREPDPVELQGADALRIENEHLRVEWTAKEGLILEDLADGRRWPGLLAFEDSGDCGDTYGFSAPADNRMLVASPDSGAVIEGGPVRQTIALETVLRIPEALDASMQRRSSRSIEHRVETRLSLESGSRELHCTVRCRNQSKDHRLRVLLRTGIEARQFHASGAFYMQDWPVGPVEQPHLAPGFFEDEPVTFPNHGLVKLADGTNGLAIFNKGLPEVQVLPKTKGTVALTLLRAVRYLGSSHIRSRSGPAGPMLETPDAQCEGDHTFEFALRPARGGCEDHAELWHRAETYRTGWFAQVSAGRKGGELPVRFGGLEVSAENVVLSSVRPVGNDRMRVTYFSTGHDVSSLEIRSGSVLEEAHFADLAGRVGDPLEILDGNRVRLEVAPFAIGAIQLKASPVAEYRISLGMNYPDWP